MYIYMYTHIYVYICTHMCVCVFVCVYMCLFIYLYMYVQVCEPKYIYMYIMHHETSLVNRSRRVESTWRASGREGAVGKHDCPCISNTRTFAVNTSSVRHTPLLWHANHPHMQAKARLAATPSDAYTHAQTLTLSLSHTYTHTRIWAIVHACTTVVRCPRPLNSLDGIR